MPVRFGRYMRPAVRQVLQFVVDAPLFVVVGSDPSFERETPLHWLSAQRRGVPCTHEDCPWCPLPTRLVTYLPVLAFTKAGHCWKERVLPINEGMWSFLKEPREKVIWQFVRRRYKNATPTWTRYDEQKWSQPFAGFDVEESLWKIWGMYGKARINCCQPGKEEPQLFQEPPATSVAG